MINNFFNPKTVAIIGASNTKGKVGYSLMKNMAHFKGTVVPININRKKIFGKKCYKSVLDYKGNIDLAVFAIPGFCIPAVLYECGKKKIKAVTIISAGFSEVGNWKAEDEIKKIAKKYGIRILGPNNFGSVNPYIGLDTSFALNSPDKGHIAFIAQSGALWVYLVEYSKGKFGFSGYASLGNMADVDFSDCIEFFNNDKNTKSIVCYVEKITDGRRFIDVCKKTKKPIIAIKVGRGEAGARAALSHTGSLAGNLEIYKAAFKQAGVILAESLTEALDKAELLSNQEIKGNKIVIVTNGGGAGVMVADHCEENNLDVVKLPENLIKKLKLPKEWSHGNPMDLIGDANYDRYKEVFNNLKKENFYDIVLVLISQQKMVDIGKTCKEVIKFKKESKKPVVCILMGSEKETKKAELLLRKNKINSFFHINRAVEALRNIKSQKDF